MRAARLVVLFVALGLVAISQIRPGSLLPAALSFIGPLRADPQPSQPPAAPDPVHPAAAEKALPDFVPGQQVLSNAPHNAQEGSPATSEPDGRLKPPQASSAAPAVGTTTGATAAAPVASPAAPGGSSVARTVKITVELLGGPEAAKTASLTAPPKAPEWPQIIGAKNLFGAVKSPAPLAARAIGSYARGCLSGAVALPIDGPAWQEMRLSRNRNWGHPKLISLVEQFAKDAQKLDGWPGLLVGDIAQPRGGPMLTGHASHQVGLDADIWLTPMPDRRLTDKEREDMQATSMLDSTEVAVDPKLFTEKQVALIKRAASYPEVERIFVHPAIKKALCKSAGTDRKWLGKVRPYYGHYYHFHVRIKCPSDFAGCTPQGPTTGDDGCGKEVDQWLAKVVPSKTPAPPPPADLKAKPPKAPVMLAELPKECQALLKAGPEPIAIPRDALLTPVEVQKVLAKAAAVNAALAKVAAAAPGQKSSPANAANSAALRPHLRKAVAADQK
jgi:penicillin-insensitive murein endopeptidase